MTRNKLGLLATVYLYGYWHGKGWRSSEAPSRDTFRRTQFFATMKKLGIDVDMTEDEQAEFMGSRVDAFIRP